MKLVGPRTLGKYLVGTVERKFACVITVVKMQVRMENILSFEIKTDAGIG